MESNDIKKALEDWIKNYDGSYINFKILGNTLDLITRQKTENENLKVENQSLRSAANSLKMHYEEAQAEIERLKSFEDKIAEFKSHIRVEDMLVFASSLEEWLEFCDNLKS